MFKKLYNSWNWGRLYALRCWFCPRQEWILDSMPVDEIDLDDVMRIAMFECVLKFDELRDPNEVNHTLQDVLEYMQTVRPRLQGYVDVLYKDLGSEGDSINFDITLSEITKISSKIDRLDAQTLETILFHRHNWTIYKEHGYER